LSINKWEKLLSRHEASRFLTEKGFKTSMSSLNRFAWSGDGPVFRKYGRMALYAPDDLIRWAEGRLSRPVKSTTEFDDQRRASANRSMGRSHNDRVHEHGARGANRALPGDGQADAGTRGGNSNGECLDHADKRDLVAAIEETKEATRIRSGPHRRSANLRAAVTAGRKTKQK